MTQRKIRQIAAKIWASVWDDEEVHAFSDKELELFANELIAIINNDLSRWLWEDLNETEP